ncbi:MAG: TRAP transporter large permease subunit, partial [Pelagibaca sp.]
FIGISSFILPRKFYFRIPLRLGRITVVNTMIGLATPPYGLLLFVVSSITRSPIRDTIRHLLPFLAIMILGLAIITFMPDLVLWLPRLYGYGG